MNPGDRIAAQAEWLQLLVRHLMGPQLRAACDPDDVVQEIVLRALGEPGRIPSSSGDSLALRRWLRPLARHTVIDAARQLRARGLGKRKHLAHSEWSRDQGSGVVLAAQVKGPLTLAGLAEERRNLLAAYDQLSSEHRRVIGLRQFLGLPASECARKMGRSESAIHSLYRRALLAWSAGGKPSGPR